MPKQVYLNVFANPFCAEPDHEGRAHGHMKYEPEGLPSDAHIPFLGCQLLATPKAKGKPYQPGKGVKFIHQVVPSGSSKAADWDHVWEYHVEPTLVPQTPYYMHALTQHGHHGPALLPADEETFVLVYGTKAGFRSPHERLHQYACERALIPRLRPTDELLAVSRAAHERKHAEAAKQAGVEAKEPPPFDPAIHRDHEAEWLAFVGKEVVAKRVALETAHKARMAELVPDSTSATV
jgi:hypothetical protein